MWAIEKLWAMSTDELAEQKDMLSFQLALPKGHPWRSKDAKENLTLVKQELYKRYRGN